MLELRHDRFTQTLVGACLILGACALAPRLLARPLPVAIEQPAITVSVEGVVAAPGVYQLEFGARVADAVAAAGGMAAGAASALVPLAAPLTDGMVVHVPAVQATDGRERVSINSATPEQLTGLPGVGPAIAERIVAARPFSRVSDLLRVSGIGERTLERLRPHVGL